MAKNIIKEIVSWILIFVVTFAIAKFVTTVVILQVKVPTGSMESTIHIDDRVIALRLSYLFRSPKRGDIVVFPYPDNESMDYIKRIIGLPGETIEGRDGVVYINGSPLEETYVTDPIDRDFGPYLIPESSYFMMGDNRNKSKDSRFWQNKYVSGEKIKGKAILKFPDFTWFD